MLQDINSSLFALLADQVKHGMIAWERPPERPARCRGFLTQTVPGTLRSRCGCLWLVLKQVYVLRVEFDDLLLLLVASLRRLVWGHGLLLRFQHAGSVTYDCQLLLDHLWRRLVLATSYKEGGLITTFVIGGGFEIVPLVRHVGGVQEARGHGFAFLDGLCFIWVLVRPDSTRLSCHVFI